uniref:G protein-coupled receptor n=1 Tax=Caenorhabditis tropicalis TaxID=1561998 RepID=A0A1I7T905_9PELO
MQGVILCVFHAAAAITYNIMQYIVPPLWLVVQGEVLWQLSCGCLSFAYLIFNRTIRNAVLKMVIPKLIRGYFGLHIGVEEHLEIERAAEATESVAIVNKGGVVVKFDNFFQN